nr:AP-4 complex subunit epsilon-1 isoform X2 [Meriones unguiculatus]
MYDVLDESLRRAELNHNVTYAILFECVHTIYSIYPKSELLEKAVKCIGKFVLSPKINLKYLGLKALTYVIQQDPSLALQHQITIIECLDHPDPIIKRETLELLYRITNAQNVVVIVQKMLEYLHQSKEEYIIINLVGKIAELAEKYAPDNVWFIQTMNAVFSVGGDVMHPDILSNFLRLLAEGFDDEVEDQQLRLYAVQSYLTLLDMENTFYPQRFLQVMSWVLGEYSYLLDEESPEEIITRLYKLLMSDFVSSETKAWLIAAVTKLMPQAHSSHIVEKLIQEFTVSLNTCLRQHAFELKHLGENVELLKSLLQGTQNGEDIVADASLSFLDGFVAEGLSQGAAPYKPHHQRQEEQLSQEKVLNFEPYGLSFSSSGFTGRQSPAGISLDSDISGNSAETGLKETSTLKLEGIKKLWGKEGYLPKKESGTGDKMEALHVPAEGATMENVEQATARKDQAQGLTQSTEEKEKQLLASSLFVGLGPENTINLLGKADVVSHKFRRKSKFKVAQSDKTPRAPNHTSSTLSTLSHVAGVDDVALNTLGGGETELSSELLGSEPVSDSELPSVEKLSSISLPAPSLFADNNMEVFHPPSSSATSTVQEINLASLLEETHECKHSSLVEVCSDENLSVSSYKIWKDDGLLMIWSVTTKTDSELTDVQLEISPVENFKIIEQPGSCLPVMEPESTKSFQYGVQMESPSVEGTLSGFINYQILDSHSLQLEFSMNLSLLDFIRPLKISTEDFGKLWLSFANDVKQTIKLSEPRVVLASVLMELQQKLRLHVIDVVGNEGLLACKLLPSTPCVLHCRVHADAVALWFRSSCSVLSDYLSCHCQKTLTEETKMSTERKFGVVVVGVGRAGSVRIRDLRGPHSSAFLNLVGFVSRRELGSLDEVRQIPLEDALCSQEIDVAYICSESSSHEDYIRQFLQAGKHVLVEYPMALSSSAAQDLWELAAQKGKVLHEEHVELLMEEFAFLKKEVTGKELLKGSLHFTASPLEEDKFGFPAFSGISRLTWLVSLFGELSLISATLEHRKEDRYLKMTVQLETQDKGLLSWIEERGPGFKRNRYLNFQFKSGSLENVPSAGVNKNIFLKDQDIFVQKLLGQVSAEDLDAEKKRILHCLGLADNIRKLCRPEE